MVSERNVYYITKKQLVSVAVIWLALPVVMFLYSWVKPLIGWPLCVAVIFSILRIINRMDNPDGMIVRVDGRFYVLLCLLFLYTVYSGIGGLFYQSSWDHAFRNAVFNDLVNNSWPVVHGNQNSGQMEMLCYYIAFWLPAAAAAKISGLIGVGYAVQFVYAFIGLLLISLFVYRILGISRSSIWILVVLAFYCGWDIVLFIIDFNEISTIFPALADLGWGDLYMTGKDWAFMSFSAPSFYALTLYVYNQGIASWLALGLLYCMRYEYGSLLLLFSLMFLFAPIPSVGLLPAMAYWTIKHFKPSFSYENIIGLFVFIVVGFYFLSNNRIGSMRSTVMPFSEYLWKFSLFLLFSYFIYFPYVWKRIRKNGLFWVMFVTATVIPYFSLSGERDLGARVGVPLTFFMAMLVLKSLTEIRSWPKYKAVAIIVTLIIGSVSTSGVYVSHIREGYRTLLNGGSFIQGWIPTVFDGKQCSLKDNFVAEGESIFTKYIMKKPDVVESGKSVDEEKLKNNQETI